LPVVRAELEDRDRLIHSRKQRVTPLEDLHDHPGVASVLVHAASRVVEVLIGVVALPHLLDREIEDVGRKPPAALPSLERPGPLPRGAGTRRLRSRPPRAARESAPRSPTGAEARDRASPGSSTACAPDWAPSTQRARWGGG